jgi:RNA polymerase sigma-70 factor, ECF subfamily
MGEARRVVSAAEAAIVEGVRDEATFMLLVNDHQPGMLRVAQMYVSSRAVAEEVVQEAWLGIIKGLNRFEGRSSLRTWMLRIVSNIAKARGQAEGRTVPFSALAGDGVSDAGVDPEWFQDATGQWPGGWKSFPDDWSGIPEDRLVAKETLQRLRDAIEALPPMQAEVIRLRDVHEWSPEEVCYALDISDSNQRVLLHRARTRVRRELQVHLSDGSETTWPRRV